MNDDKLIAEFMGYEFEGEFWVATMSKEDDTFLGRYLLFRTDWEWLMPVVEKIKDMGYDQELDKIDNVLTCDLRKGNLYKAVVEFIKDHNRKQDKPLKLSGEMIEVPIEEETIFFWDDFNTSRKKK